MKIIRKRVDMYGSEICYESFISGKGWGFWICLVWWFEIICYVDGCLDSNVELVWVWFCFIYFLFDRILVVFK